jgi:hypothetical protein
VTAVAVIVGAALLWLGGFLCGVALVTVALHRGVLRYHDGR